MALNPSRIANCEIVTLSTWKASPRAPYRLSVLGMAKGHQCSAFSPVHKDSMGPLQVRQDMFRYRISWCDLPQYGAFRTAMVIRAASGHQTVTRGAALKQGKGIRVMAMVVHFETNEPHGFEGVEERIQDVWICAQRAWVGERAYSPSLCHQSKGIFST